MKGNKDFKEDFFFLLNKIKIQEPFAFARFSDGEQYILDNIELKLDKNLIKIGNQHQPGPYKPIDFKHFDPKKHAYHRNLLIESFLHKQHNYFKGIGCPCCNSHEYKANQLNTLGGDSEDLTWANLWVNGNYPDFIKKILPELYKYTKSKLSFLKYYNIIVNATLFILFSIYFSLQVAS